MSDYPTSLAEAMAVLQTRLPEIKKSERADVKTDKGSYSYTYADLAQVSRELLPIMGALGLSFSAKPTFVEGKFVLAYVLRHTSNQTEEGTYPLPTSGTPQAIGSAITYGRRYALCAITGVSPEDDDDGAAVQAQTESMTGTAQRTNRTTRPRPAPSAGQGGTAQRARPEAAAPPPLPGEPDMATTPMLQKLVISLEAIGVEREERLRICSRWVGRELASAKGLTKAEAHRLIDLTEKAATESEPLAFLLARVPDAGGDA